jgi:hypothetical protein
VLETQLRMNERHGDSDAKALEVAGGFAPTIGIIGTVVGLIEVLRQFSNLQAVGGGIGTALRLHDLWAGTGQFTAAAGCTSHSGTCGRNF